MSTPQQPELHRSGKGASDPKSASVDGPQGEQGPTGPVPPDNQRGHHPEKDQDKPEGPPASQVG